MLTFCTGRQNLIRHLSVKIGKLIGEHGPDFNAGGVGLIHIVRASKGYQIPVCIFKIEPSRTDRINSRCFGQNLFQLVIGRFTIHTMPSQINFIIFRNTGKYRLCKGRFRQSRHRRRFQIFIFNPAIISVLSYYLGPFITIAVIQYIDSLTLFKVSENRTFYTALITNNSFPSTHCRRIDFSPFSTCNNPVWLRIHCAVHLCVVLYKAQRDIQHTVPVNSDRYRT